MKIKRYKLKDGVTRDELISNGFKEGGSWIIKDCDVFKTYYIVLKELRSEFSIAIAFKKNINYWNDFDNVLVMDEDFG